MKSGDLKGMLKRISPGLPDFTVKGSLLFIVPIGHTLRGFCIEPSGFDSQGFYAYVFFMPLYVPLEHIHLTFGNRIRNAGWTLEEANLESELLLAMQREVPFLKSLSTPGRVAEALRQRLGDSSNPHVEEAIAYSLASEGEDQMALDSLRDLMSRLDKSIGWQAVIAERSLHLQKLLLSDVNAAKDQLNRWERETVTKIGLARYY